MSLHSPILSEGLDLVFFVFLKEWYITNDTRKNEEEKRNEIVVAYVLDKYYF